MAAGIRAVFNAPGRLTAEALLALTAKYISTVSKLVNWLEADIPEGVTLCTRLAKQRRPLLTVIGLERLNRALRR